MPRTSSPSREGGRDGGREGGREEGREGRREEGGEGGKEGGDRPSGPSPRTNFTILMHKSPPSLPPFLLLPSLPPSSSLIPEFPDGPPIAFYRHCHANPNILTVVALDRE